MNTKLLRMIGSGFLLLAVALAAASCDGFFVDPTLTSVSVGPQNLSIQINEQWKMSATGTYSDGSQKTLTSGVFWFSADSAVASDGPVVWPGNWPYNWFGYDLCQFRELLGMHRIYYGECRRAGGQLNRSDPGRANRSDKRYSGLLHGIGKWLDRYYERRYHMVGSGSSGLDQTSNFTLAFVQGKGEGFLPGSNAGQGTYRVRVSYNGVIGTAVLNVQ